MQAFELYEQAVSDLTWNGTAFTGTCPVCGSETLKLEVYGQNEFMPTCSKKCSLTKIDAAVAGAATPLNGHAAEAVAERPVLRIVDNQTPTPQRAPPVFRPDIYTAAELMKMQFQEITWAVPEIVCQGFNIVAGSQKLGKSWLCYGIAIAVATGGKALGKVDVDQGDVLYLALEDRKRRMKDRLLQILDTEEAPPRLFICNQWPPMGEGCLGHLRTWLKAHPKTRLVIVDTLKKIKPRGRKSTGSAYDDDYEYATEVKSVADEFDVAVIAVHHTRKAPAEDIFDTVNASMGLTAAADATIVFDRKRGNDHAYLHMTGRDIEDKVGEDALAVQWDRITGTWTLVGRAEEFMRSDERSAIIKVLKLSAKPLSPKEVADMLNKNRSTVRTLLSKMLFEGQVTRSGEKYGPPHTPLNPIDSVDSRHETAE